MVGTEVGSQLVAVLNGPPVGLFQLRTAALEDEGSAEKRQVARRMRRCEDIGYLRMSGGAGPTSEIAERPEDRGIGRG